MCIEEPVVIHIETPLGCDSERLYTLGVLFRDWLGLAYRLHQTERGDTCVSCVDLPGELHLPDTFFSQFGDNAVEWLSPESLPRLPLVQWDTRALTEDLLLIEPKVPVLFGDAQPGMCPTVSQDGRQIRLPLDIFGAVFFMLSRYEEAVSTDRDQHDRFPATASIAYKALFLDRPIVDEYGEILRSAMRQLWPAVEHKPRQAQTLVSCDVDMPFAFHASLKRTVRQVGGDILKRHSFTKAASTCASSWQAHRGNYKSDPYRAGIDFIMDTNERAGRSVVFYFIAENTDLRLDNRVSLDEPRMRALLREIHSRGHEIGIHPGYHAYRDPEATTRSVATLRKVLDNEGIDQPRIGGRQHFLRWESSITARICDESGLDYDSTLGYADRPGFRCGTSREYPLYDLHRRKALRLRERPLIVMECTIAGDQYMGLGYTIPTLELMMTFRDRCHKFAGNFVLLWHNSELREQAAKDIYSSLIS